MDRTSIIQQLQILVSSLIQIVKLLESFAQDNSAAQSANVQRLHDTKFELIEAVLSFNEIFYSQRSNDVILFPGCLVLAPRYFGGNMCSDLAIVTMIKNSTTDSDRYVSQEEHTIEISSTESVAYMKDANQIIKVTWLRPHSRYELYADCISFGDSQLDVENVPTYLTHQSFALQSLQIGEVVLFISLLNDAKYGTWQKGTVKDVLKDRQLVHIIPLAKDTGSVDSIVGSLVLPIKATFIAPLPRPKESVLTKSTLSSSPEENGHKHLTYTQVDEIEPAHEGITSLPSLYDAMLSANAAKTNSVALTGPSTALGLWERHTKGIGGKILAKMGFKRSLGGLGKHGQGIVNPIESSTVPLPAGLGLDFVHEVKKGKSLSFEEGEGGRGGGGGGEAGDAVRRKIVQEFNNRMGRPAKKQRNQQKEEEEERCVFSFLNTLEVKTGGSSDSLRKTPRLDAPPALPSVKMARQSKHVF